MTELTMWKYLTGATLIIGFLIRMLVEFMKRGKSGGKGIYICPLDKSGMDSKLKSIANDIDKEETKLNRIITIVDYNKSFIEQIHSNIKLQGLYHNLVMMN